MLEEFVPFFQKEKTGWKKWLGHIYVTLVVMIGFVFFRADDMKQGMFWVGQMFTGLQFDDASMRLVLSLLTPVHLTAFAAGIAATMPVFCKIGRSAKICRLLWPASLVLLAVCMVNLAGGTYNPFIYFRF